MQQHCSPDRLTTPMIRENGALEPASWEKAMALLGATVTPAGGGGRRVWLTGPTSGHQQILLRGLVEAGAATDHLVYDALSTAVEASVNRKLFGVDEPVTLIDKAGLVLSFGRRFSRRRRHAGGRRAGSMRGFAEQHRAGCWCRSSRR